MLIKNILIFISFTVCGYGRLSFAIRCESPHLPIEDVRQVIASCSRKFIANEMSNDRENPKYSTDDYQPRFDTSNHESHSANGNHRTRQHNQYSNRQHESLQPSYTASNNNNNASTLAQDETTRACILQCFFEEFKMVNHEGFPDKRKMAQVLTREVNWELRNFYLDSIDQCFRIMEYEVKTYVDKCFFARRIIDCLTEIASLNCSDWDGERIMI